MCFSATASFTVAASTAVIGIALLKHVRYPKEILVAIVPLLFAFQQAVEGVLWLQLPQGTDEGNVGHMTLVFLLFAQVLWPVYTAIAVVLVEPAYRRRLVLFAITIAGLMLSIHLAVELFGNTQVATIHGHSIAYGTRVDPMSWQQLPYVICTGVPPLISSHRPIRIFGIAILVGFFVSAYFFVATFVSVWCFFAAAGSILLYFCFKRDALRIGYCRS